MGNLGGKQLPAELFSEQFGRRIVGFGDYSGNAVDEEGTAATLTIEQDPQAGFVAQYRTATGTLLGAVVCDQPRAAIALRKELRKELSKEIRSEVRDAPSRS